jgi:predicted MPP superfamily phosphohydrolase
MWLLRSGIFLLAYIGINIYTGIRLFTLIKYFLPSLRHFIFWPFYIIFCFFFLWINLLRFGLLRPLRSAAMNSLPALFYFFLALVILDLARFVLQRFHVLSGSLVYSVAGVIIAMGIAALVMVYGIFNARDIHTVYYNVALKKNLSGQEAGLRVALISDLHIGTTVSRKWIANIVDAVNKTKPDIICIAGDVFDNGIDMVTDLEGVAEELRRFDAPLGVYACPGNHDVDRFSFRGEGKTEHIHDFLKTVNIDFLQDEVVLIKDDFYLAGRKDARPIGIREERKPVSELAAGLDKSRPLIVMDHQPVDFKGNEEAGADLIFSGHTHRGQFFPGNIATKRIFRAAGAVHYGYWRGRSSQAVVSSGAGVWGPPIRVATRSEVAVVDVWFSREGGI